MNDFLHLGEIFKKKRQEKNLTLKEVENATSIRIHYLAAIEEGHFGKLISPIYAQGFIKRYAAFLDLDGEQLINENPELIKMLKTKRDEKEDFAFGLGTLEVRGAPGHEVKGMPSLLWIGISAAVLVVAWFALRYFHFL